MDELLVHSMQKHQTVPDASVVLVAGLDSLLGHDPPGVMVLPIPGGCVRLEARGAVQALLGHHAPVPNYGLSQSRIISFIKLSMSFEALS